MGIFRHRGNGQAREIAAQLETLQSELSALRKDAKKLSEGLSRTATAAVDTAEVTYDGLGKWSSGNIGLVRDWGRDKPLTACLASIGLGAVLGVLFLRR